MSTITTHEEMHVLHEIIPFLLRKGRLSLNQLHRDFVIAPRYKKPDGSLDDEEARKVVGILVSNGVYKVLAEFLVVGGFANYYSDPEEDPDVITVNLKGEYLSAHGSLDAFNKAIVAKISQSELEERTTLLLAEIFPFSEFSITPNKRKPIPHITGHELEDIMTAIKNRELMMRDIIVKEHQEFIKDERVVEYLVHYGFAVNRYDIARPDTLYRQLTDKGRELKECGSIGAYNKIQELKNEEFKRAVDRQATEEKRSDNEYERNRLMFFVTVLIGISTFVQASKDFLDIANGEKASQSIVVMSFLFVFFAGGLSTVCIWLIIEEVRKRRGE